MDDKKIILSKIAYFYNYNLKEMKNSNETEMKNFYQGKCIAYLNTIRILVYDNPNKVRAVDKVIFTILAIVI